MTPNKTGTGIKLVASSRTVCSIPPGVVGGSDIAVHCATRAARNRGALRYMVVELRDRRPFDSRHVLALSQSAAFIFIEHQTFQNSVPPLCNDLLLGSNLDFHIRKCI